MTVFIVFFVLIALYLQHRSKQGDLSCLEARISADTPVVEPEQDFYYVCELHNRSMRFLPFLKLHIYVPEGVSFPKLKKGSVTRASASGYELLLTTWLLPRQSLKLEVPAVIQKRGRYFTNGMTVSEGDFFGMTEYPTRYDNFVEVICLPKEAENPDELKIAGGFPGDVSVNRFIFEDPTLAIGCRDYTGREPMKQISWMRSAREGRLMVKEMDHTLETSVSVVLNVETDDAQTAEAHAAIERAYSLTRYVCRRLEEQRITYSFSTNAEALGNVRSWRYIGEGLGKSHFCHILEGLGRSGYTACSFCAGLVSESVRRSSSCFGLIFITAADGGRCRNAELLAQRAGLQIFCINAGGER